MKYLRVAFDDGDGLTRAWAMAPEQACFNDYGEDTTVEEAVKVAESQLAKYLESTAGRLNCWNRHEDYTMVTEWFDESTLEWTPATGEEK